MMGVLMAIRGPKRRLEIESEYWRLILSGVGTVEACKQVGIGRKTGYRWRAENGGLPPARMAESARSDRYLSLLERQRIATLRERGLGVREIARRLGRSPSTNSRELRRNTSEHDRGGYDGDLAHARARQRMRRPRRGRVLQDAELRAEIQAKLELEWSPEQIAAHLRRSFPDRPNWHLCHETIYQAIYHGGRGGLSRQLTAKLRTGRPLRRRRRRPDQRRIRFVAPAVLIEHRPAIVEKRVRVGDWEGDLITGRLNQSAIGTLVDRTSRYLRLIPLPNGHAAEHVRDGLLAAFADVPKAARWTLTWDQGSEMAFHDQVAPLFHEGVFFAQPASPWQRGTNENTNRLLRQYFPKGTNLSLHSAEDLRAVERRLNSRPRKSLGWCTPAEVFASRLPS
ncbi:IS30 family transposase [Nonomuraea lactucae]|uniref:IS30 family transposase n=1 Tax=Nonomuraea lactucae TaxID=2249762 RepID=UPI0019622B2A|nr:IS30 family transposase [Nonomuraea lactucae]